MSKGRARLASRTTASIMKKLIEAENEQLKQLIDLVFVADQDEKDRIHARLLDQSRLKLKVFEQLKSGDYHEAETTINKELLG